MTEHDTTPIGDVLRLSRSAIRQPRHQTAVKAGVSHSYVGMVERGDRAPSRSTSVRLLKAAGCQVDTSVIPWRVIPPGSKLPVFWVQPSNREAENSRLISPELERIAIALERIADALEKNTP